MTRIATFILAGALALVVGAAHTPSYAQSSSQIEDALKLKGPDGKPVTRSLTRSLNADPRAQADKKVIDKARTRAISIEAVQPAAAEERAEIAKLVEDKPK